LRFIFLLLKITKSYALALAATLLLITTGHSHADMGAAISSTASLTITSPSAAGTILPEMDEFATMVLNDPWDMEQPTDLAYYRQVDSGLANSTFSNSIYSAQMSQGAGGERITLLTVGAANNTAMRIGKTGYNFPINADHYRYLTFRMYSSNDQCNSGVIRWYADDTLTWSSMGVTTPFLVPPAPCTNRPPGWYTYVVDLKTAGLWQGDKEWSGTIRELIIQPFAGDGAAGATVKLDWARLTAADPRSARPYTITWTGNGSGGPVSLYAREGTPELDGNQILIGGNLSANGGSYTFQTGTFAAGTYYIAAVNENGVAWSGGPITINAPPQVTITRPSMTSGQDYAATELGRPWDMTGVTDLNHNLQAWQQTCVTNESFSNGIYAASLISSCPGGTYYVDPILFLGRLDRTPPGQQDPPIDTNKYRYLSYRFYHSGTQNVGHGWVARWGWWQVHGNGYTVLEEPVMGRDMIIQEGWNVYKADLWAPDVVDEAHPIQRSWRNSAPNRLRFDPSELATSLMPATIRLDWIKLTAMDEVKRGQVFPITYQVQSDRPVQLAFYYDTDKNPHNGRTSIGARSFSPATLAVHSAGGLPGLTNAGAGQGSEGTIGTMLPDVSHKLFLPIVTDQYCGSECFTWHTGNVAPGTYYICIESTDGHNNTYRCSEAPLIIRP
jgi:hypothetical protein